MNSEYKTLIYYPILLAISVLHCPPSCFIRTCLKISGLCIKVKKITKLRSQKTDLILIDTAIILGKTVLSLCICKMKELELSVAKDFFF